MPAGWGSLTRRGARELTRPDAGRDMAPGSGSRPEGRERTPWGTARPERPAGAPERPARRVAPAPALSGGEDETGRRPRRAGGPGGPEGRRAGGALRRSAPVRPAPVARASRGVGGAQRGEVDVHEPKLVARLKDATRAYAADRYQEALRDLRRLAELAPESSAVRELLGLTLYRMGRWAPALKELQAHHDLTSSYDQYPVMADCYRALRRYAEADELWSELRQASPDGEVVAEGRLVAAGVLADQGDLQGAVRLLEGHLKRARPNRAQLRQWYALADLYERAGELPRAREIFGQVTSVDPDAYDVVHRLRALG